MTHLSASETSERDVTLPGVARFVLRSLPLPLLPSPMTPFLAVPPNSKVRLADVDPRATPDFDDRGNSAKERAAAGVAANVAACADLQARLYAQNKHALLVVLQGMDTSGKDGVVRHVFSGLNPQGCHVTSFKKPSEAEADRDFLWRIHAAVPPRGDIAVFNRAHYEDVLIVRVHNFVPEHVWSARYEMINQFEHYLTRNHVRIVKIMLHISKDEQRQRLQARIDDPTKNWKFQPGDIEERKFWNDYQAAYEAILERCSTPWAPWHVVPADRKWYRDWAISRILREHLESINPQFPAPTLDPKSIVID